MNRIASALMALGILGALSSACEDSSGGPVAPDAARVTPPPATPPLPSSWQVECVDCGVNAVWGTTAHHVFATGFQTAVHYNGRAWKNIVDGDAFFEGTFQHIGGNGVWVSPNRGIMYTLAAPNVTTPIYQYDGHFSQAPVSDDFGNWVFWGLSGTASEMFVTGEFGNVYRSDGTSVTGLCFGGFSGNEDDFFDAWGSGDDIIAVGANFPNWQFGTITQCKAGGFKTWIHASEQAVPALHAVWGSSPANVFAVGNGGTILRFDGGAWSGMDSGTTANLCDIWGTGADNIWAVGSGVILHFDGAAWSAVDTGIAGAGGCGVWGTPDGVLLVAGGPGGRILRGTP